nr:integumentary mucin C.1-like [Cherax quadricarinatus]
MTSGLKAKNFISVAVNYGSINYHGYKPDGQAFMLVAEAGSLSPVIEPDCTITASTSTTESTTTTTATTTTTIPDHSTTTTKPPRTDQSTSTTTTTTTTTTDPNNPNQIVYSSGDLAGLGIGLLLIGLAVGTCGTFLVVVKKIHLTVLGWFKA